MGNMASQGDIIKIGTIPAVICELHGDGSAAVIYRDARRHVIGEKAVPHDGSWRFAEGGKNAGWFADKKPAWSDYVAILEAHHRQAPRSFMDRLQDRKRPQR